MNGTLDLAAGFHARLAVDRAAGELRDGAIRYLMMRPDALMGLFARLAPEHRAPALEALAASVAEHGGRSAAAYRDSGAADPEAMMQVIAATSADLGWGVWSFARQGPRRIEVTVANSPFAAGIGRAGAPVCAPVRGMLAAIGPLLLGCDRAEVAETRCRAVTGEGPCRFAVTG
ncbi:V4R domain-containing protein [Poseidonocella sp. HB161398]|uniref:V4R domain-containing protein n=1 Tax=Poseidonocella sp. HB161398 TaxID=2320855 RepID=UPI00110A00F7|nr:V4R domain-containing protein [Poseidonocella sp. HB161398]